MFHFQTIRSGAQLGRSGICVAFGVVFFYFGFVVGLDCTLDDVCLINVLCEVAIVSQLSYPILVHYMGLCEDDPSCDKTNMRLCL